MHRSSKSLSGSVITSENRDDANHKTRTLFGRAIVLLLLMSSLTNAQESDPAIDGAMKSVNDRRDATWQIAQKIWLAAEPGYQETQSSALLADAATT